MLAIRFILCLDINDRLRGIFSTSTGQDPIVMQFLNSAVEFLEALSVARNNE
jgi:hypothetical protein